MPRKNKRVTTRASTKRKSNGGHYTVAYTNGAGIPYFVGYGSTKHEILHDIIVNSDNYPAGNGKVVWVE